jgi:hypothetical protein
MQECIDSFLSYNKIIYKTLLNQNFIQFYYINKYFCMGSQLSNISDYSAH